MNAQPAAEDDTYIDYDTFLSPSFSPYQFANTLITSTNDPSDPTLDLSTPLSRVLFDLQEIDTHIHTLTTTSALPLLTFTHATSTTSTSLLATLEAQLRPLNAAYTRLHAAIATRSLTASQLLTATQNLHSLTTQLRELSRALVLARNLDSHLSQLADPKALVRAAHTIQELTRTGLLAGVDDAVTLKRELLTSVFAPAETHVAARARAALVDFAVDENTGFGAGVGVRSGDGGVAAAASALLLLGRDADLLVSAVQAAVNNGVTAGLGALTRSLTALTTLDRAVAEVVARCRNLVALEAVLAGVPAADGDASLLATVLDALDTGSLMSMFFRSVAAGLEPRVREVVAKGGSNGRILKGSKDRLRAALRSCVEMGVGRGEDKGRVEFEVAVMVGAAGSLGR